MDSGQRWLAEKVWDQLEDLATRSADAWVQIRSDVCGLSRLLLDGRLQEAADRGTEVVEKADSLGMSTAGRGYSANSSARIHILLGRSEEAVALLLPKELGFEGTISQQARAALCLAAADRPREASEILRRLTSGADVTAIEDCSVRNLAQLLEVAVVLRNAEVATRIASVFAESDDSLATCDAAFVCLSRLLGGAAALLGETEKARGYYLQAIEICEKVRFRPEIALTRLELAELLLEHYPDERAAAIEHLDFALGEFREMKMQPSLERALRHKEVLKA